MNAHQPRVRKRFPQPPSQRRNVSVSSNDGELPIGVHPKTSVGKSTLSEDKDEHVRKTLGPREYLLLLIEASMSLTAFVIEERNLAEPELRRSHYTYRATEINILHYEGYSAPISMFIGCLVDSYIKHYTLALLSIILHFAIMCTVAMEYAINFSLDPEDYPYEELLLMVCYGGLVLIKATNFTRLVYGLEGMVARKHRALCNFIFLNFWMSSSASYGGVMFNLCFGLFKLNTHMIIVAFIMCGLSLFAFVVFLRPESEMKDHEGLGCKVVCCLLTATLCKACFTGNKRLKRTFFAHVEGTYTRITITRTQQLLWIYAILSSSLGIVFATMIREDIFFDFRKIKIDMFPLGLTPMYRAVKLICMLLSYFALWPLLAWLSGLWKRKHKNLIVKYLTGHFLVVGAMLYVAIWTRIVEVYPHTLGSGYLRIYNTARNSVRFTHTGEFTMQNFTVGPKEGIMLSFPTQRYTLFPMTVAFEGGKNLTNFLSVAAGQVTGYMVVDPLRVVRIRGLLPLREGPPGTNKESRPILYIFNSAVTLFHATITITDVHEKSSMKEVDIVPGVMSVLSLKPSVYDIRIHKAGIRASAAVKEGGVYGIMVYTVKTTREISIDTLVEPSTASPWHLLAYYIPAGLGHGLAYPSLLAVLYSVVPHGLPAMSFAFVAFLEGVSFWISFIGFITWHPFVNSTTLFLYASAAAVFFLMNIFCFMKTKDRVTQ